MEIKLLIFKVVVGCDGMPWDEAQRAIEQVQAAVKMKEIPGYAFHHYVIPDFETTKMDITLLYPTVNSLMSDKELLDLMISKGEVPQEVIDKINKEITIQ
jgi:hypothetical protein